MPETATFHRRAGKRRDRRRTVLVRRAVKLAIRTAVATVVAIAGVVIAWRAFSQWRLGRIELSTEGPPLLIQILDETGTRPIGEPIDLLTRITLDLPDGEYRLQASAVGRLSRTARFTINRGETAEYKLSLDEGRLLGHDPDASPWGGSGDRPREGPLPFAFSTEAIELTPGKFDIVEFTGETVVRRDGTTGKPVWDAMNPLASFEPARDPGRWLRRMSPFAWRSPFVEPAIDLDGDGTRDVLLASDNTCAFLALSGKDGSMLWNYVAGDDGSGGPLPEDSLVSGSLPPSGRRIMPIDRPALGDINGDGVPDLIATLEIMESREETTRRVGKPPSPTGAAFFRRFVHAISGHSGRLLWVFPLDPSFTHIKAPSWSLRAALVRGRKVSTVAFVDGEQWILLDPATGKPRTGPVDLGDIPVRSVQYADLDGDSEPEMLMLTPGPTPKQQSLTAFATGSGQPRWTVTIRGSYSREWNRDLTVDWPWLVDLEGDGRPEIVVLDSAPLPPKTGYRGLQVLDGATGKSRWVRPMSPTTKADDGTRRVLEAPDLDGDGVRELIAVSRFEGRDPPATPQEPRLEHPKICVDALSGKDGHPLWCWHADLPVNKTSYLWPPTWWGRGPDGWPLLAIPVGGKNMEGSDRGTHSSFFHPPVVYVLEASTGRLVREATGLSQAHVADLDGDGLMDLWGEVDGQLRAFRGEPPEAWSALGQYAPARKPDSLTEVNLQPSVDLDGDGTADTLKGASYTPADALNEARGSRFVSARSGRDGHLLWKTALDPPWLGLLPEHGRSYGLSAFPLPAGDLDGDGTSDVIVQKHTQDESEPGRKQATLPIQALSGRDGRLLWSAGPLPLGFEAHGYSTIVWIEPRIIEPSSPPDLVVLHRCPFLKGSSKPIVQWVSWGPAQTRLARVSGRTGRVLWDVTLEEFPTTQQTGRPLSFSLVLDDLDGDGSLDAALVVHPDTQGNRSEFEFKVVSLRDGAIRWTRRFLYKQQFLESPDIQIAKAEKSQAATVFLTERPATKTGNELVVHALDGRDGTERWSWRSGGGAGHQGVSGGIDPIALDGWAKDAVCVTYSDEKRNTRIVIVDAQGRQRAQRRLPPEPHPTEYDPPVQDAMFDLDGDGRDELLVWYDGVFQAWNRNLKEIWKRPEKWWPMTGFLPQKPGQPGTLILRPLTAIDGVTGEVRWAYKSPSRWWIQGPSARLVDPGDARSMPLLTAIAPSVTVCRYALATTPEGNYLPPAGSLTPPGLARDDPRWTRPLPWTRLIAQDIGPRGFLGLFALALINVMLPLWILWLASRRGWTVRALMALPVAAALPLSVFQAVELFIPTQVGRLLTTPRLAFAVGTIAGIPIAAFVVFAAWCLIQRRWKHLVLLAVATVLASALTSAVWLGIDSRAMPAIEHYQRSNWPLAVILGAYSLGIALVSWWTLQGMHRLLSGRRTVRSFSREG